MPNLDFLPGMKTKVGAAILIGLGIYMVIDGDIQGGLGLASMGLAAFGIKMAIGRQEVPSNLQETLESIADDLAYANASTMGETIEGIAEDMKRVVSRKTVLPAGVTTTRNKPTLPEGEGK